MSSPARVGGLALRQPLPQGGVWAAVAAGLCPPQPLPPCLYGPALQQLLRSALGCSSDGRKYCLVSSGLKTLLALVVKRVGTARKLHSLWQEVQTRVVDMWGTPTGRVGVGATGPVLGTT